MTAKEVAAVDEKHFTLLWGSLFIIFCALFLAFSIPRGLQSGPTGAVITGSSFASASYVFSLIGLVILIYLVYSRVKK